MIYALAALAILVPTRMALRRVIRLRMEAASAGDRTSSHVRGGC